MTIIIPNKPMPKINKIGILKADNTEVMTSNVELAKSSPNATNVVSIKLMVENTSNQFVY